MISKVELAAIKARELRATPDPWATVRGDGAFYVRCVGQEAAHGRVVADAIRSKWDADFIAHSRHDIRSLVAEVERLTGLVNSTIPGLLAENENLLGFIKHLIAVHQRPADGCGMCAAIAAKLAEEEAANKEVRE